MPVVNYYTIDGAILWEETVNSSARTYGPDALGSVVATYDSNGLKQNFYHFKPYGAQASKTGTAADPKFTWVGSLGYRQMETKYPDVYVRARHYSSGLACWPSVDPLWPRLSPYSYSSRHPASMADPSGLQGTIGTGGSHGFKRSCVSLGVLMEAPPTCVLGSVQGGYASVNAYAWVDYTALVGSLDDPGTGCDIRQWVRWAQFGVERDNGVVNRPLGDWKDDGSQVCWKYKPSMPLPGTSRGGVTVGWIYLGLDGPGQTRRGPYDNDCKHPVQNPGPGNWAILELHFEFFVCCNCPGLSGTPKPADSDCQQFEYHTIDISVDAATGECDVE